MHGAVCCPPALQGKQHPAGQLHSLPQGPSCLRATHAVRWAGAVLGSLMATPSPSSGYGTWATSRRDSLRDTRPQCSLLWWQEADDSQMPLPPPTAAHLPHQGTESDH